MVLDFDHMRAMHGELLSFWLVATAVIGVGALLGIAYLAYRDWRLKRRRRDDRRKKRREAKRRNRSV